MITHAALLTGFYMMATLAFNELNKESALGFFLPGATVIGSHIYKPWLTIATIWNYIMGRGVSSSFIFCPLLFPRKFWKILRYWSLYCGHFIWIQCHLRFPSTGDYEKIFGKHIWNKTKTYTWNKNKKYKNRKRILLHGFQNIKQNDIKILRETISLV